MKKVLVGLGIAVVFAYGSYKNLELKKEEAKKNESSKKQKNNDEENTQPKYTAEDAKNMSDDEFLDAYKKGMPSEGAEAVDELSKDPTYREYLRGQIEAREKG
ncbi:hypothetical protein [Staphylococcus equorum]|uniref:hypothetical protein n=1 Tax=Staphylococcus equorum TaxID=246432 RepID=UPI00101B6D68|nr:hypothetical protein [Staphylococcus equorum]MDK9848056.1 hypothetical protein [Staphylococcus equorum]MDK9852432.1 hypothetical protein [Staphylococcus equorum]MDK9858039.1 hypothetical protein [Staphylococcus equorum]MDK9875099.1 hypothetical protein [Staphylococcus equorum]RYD12236.1 hypothetical protein CGA19_08880 [Staphylococcus equorum]